MEEMVTITKTKYDLLVERSFELKCLEAGGVDNWEWYSESLQPYYKKFHPEELEDDEEDDEN